MFVALVILSSVARAGAPDPPRFFVVDFAPVANQRKTPLPHSIRFAGVSANDKRIDFSAPFHADKTPTEVRDIAYGHVKKVGLAVKKAGDTKLLLIGCKFLNVVAEAPVGMPNTVERQPATKAFDTEKDVREELLATLKPRTMFSVLALASALSGGIRGDPPDPTRFFVLDFAPVDNLGKASSVYRVVFFGFDHDGNRIDFHAKFRAGSTPTDARDAIFDIVRIVKLDVKKLGETKLLIGCKSLAVVTEGNGAPVAEKCRPTLKVFDSEKDALKEK